MRSGFSEKLDLPGCVRAERTFPGWRVYRATFDRTVWPDVEVPEGHYWAVHLEFYRPCVVAPDVDALIARLTVVDQARIDEVIVEVRERYPRWRVRYVRQDVMVRGVACWPTHFCATRRWGWSWRHVALGQNAAGLLREIAVREKDLRDIGRWAWLREDVREALRRLRRGDDDD